MSITFPCSGCGKQFRASAEHAGKPMKCPHCATVTRIPAPRDRAGPAARAPAAAVVTQRSAPRTRPSPVPPTPPRPKPIAPVPDRELVQCPHCRSECRIRPEWRGKKLECPTCKTRFVVPLVAQRAAATAPALHSDDAFVTDDPAETHGIPANTDVFDLADEGPAAPAMLPPPRSFKKKKKARFSSSGFSDWMQGPGLWILDAVGLVILLIVFAIAASQATQQAAQSGVFLVGLMIVFGIGFTIVIAVAALILLGACSILGEDPPGFGRCMGIVFLIWLAQIVAGMIMGSIVEPVTPENFDVSRLLMLLTINLLVGFATAAGVLTVTLGISYGKALLIWLVEVVIGAVLLFVFICVLALALPGLQMARRGGGANSPNTPSQPNAPFNFPSQPNQFPGSPSAPGGGPSGSPGPPAGGGGLPGFQPGSPGGPGGMPGGMPGGPPGGVPGGSPFGPPGSGPGRR